MSKYTPGPWEYLPTTKFHCGAILSRANLSWICEFNNNGISPENAKLIASAPELLEALEAAIPLLHTGDELPLEYYKDKPSILGKALRAIAKAKGEL